MFGFVLLSINTYQLTQLSTTTSFNWIRFLLVIRGLALGFALQPTQLTAMAAVPPRLNTAASSLNTAMRNIFQSFGIAMLATIVQTQTTVHMVTMSWQVRSDTMSGAALAVVSNLLQQRGVPAASATAAAIALVLGQIRQQASVLAFGDAYRVTFVASLVALGLATLLPAHGLSRTGSGGEPSMAMGH